MALKTYSYCSGSEFAGIIHSLLKEFSGQKNNLRFIVPSRKDKRWMPENDGLILWTWQDVYEDITIPEKRKRTLSPPDHLLILKSILEASLEDYPEKVNVLPGLKRSGFLSVLSDDIRELLNEAVHPDKLPNNPESNNPSEFLLPEVYLSYLEYLNTSRLIDSAQVYTAAYEAVLENQEWGKDLVIVFAGFLSFNHAQLELVGAIKDRCDRTIIIKPEAYMSGFHDASSQLGEYTPPPKSSGRIIIMSPAEPSLEPEIIARTLAIWSSGKLQDFGEFPGFDTIGLMIEDGREASFTEAFMRYGVPYDFSDGVVISQTLPGKILSSLRHLNSRQFPAYDTAMLLTQPCFAGSGFPVMRAYKAGRSGLSDWMEYLSERVNDPEEKSQEAFRRALLSVEAITKFCGIIEAKNIPARIMEAFSEFLNAQGLWLTRDDDISDFPELDESRRIIASAIQTVGEKALSLRELLPDIGTVKDDILEGEDAFDFLEEWCRNSYTRAPLQLSNSVRIFTGTPPVLAFFPVWIISGVTQKTWSPNMKASPLLGNEEREKLRENEAYLPRTKEKAEQHEALFRRLLQTGENLTVISRPLLDSEGRPVSESPFVQKFLDDMTGWKKENLSSEGINILLGSDGYTFTDIDATEKVYRETPNINGKANNVGASDIQELLGCPFLWWQRKQSKLYQPDSELVSPAQWGNMLHKYWEFVWKIYREDMAAPGTHFVSIAKSEWARLLQADDDNYGKYSALVNDRRFSRRLEGVKFRAERLAVVQAQILDTMHKTYRHEKILLEDEAQLIDKIDGISFSGQCDRTEILRGFDGKEVAFIADYKEGHKSSGSYDEGMKDITGRRWNVDPKCTEFRHGLQLSVYAALFRREYGCDVSGVYILGHEDGKIAGTFSDTAVNIFADFLPYDDKGEKVKPDIDIVGRRTEGEYSMQCAVRILKAGEFAPDYSYGPCNYCHIKSICRKGEFRGEVSGGDGDNEEQD